MYHYSHEPKISFLFLQSLLLSEAVTNLGLCANYQKNQQKDSCKIYTKFLSQQHNDLCHYEDVEFLHLYYIC